MTKDEALKMALEAFGEIDWSNNSQWQSDRAKVAIATLKKALAQPEQDGECKHCTDGCPACDSRKLPEQPPYHHFVSDRFNIDPQTGNLNIGAVKKPKQDVGITRYADISVGKIIHNSSPPQRTWVGLTDEEIRLQWSEFWEAECHFWAIDFAKAIEAKLRSKNDRND